MKNTFLAVSSDSRPLYKADVYKTLAKPNEAIEHFRYQKKWISTDPECVTNDALFGSEVILIYKHVESCTSSIYLPIRRAVIVGFFHDNDTDMYHYYFSLREFCSLKEDPNIEEGIFFLKNNNINAKTDLWKNKIDAVKPYFDNHFFYRILSIKDKYKRNIKLSHDRVNHSYYYTLVHGNSYTLEIAIANPNESENTLTIKPSSADINVVITENYLISAPYDILKIPITTKSLDTYNERSFLSFFINDKEVVKIKEYENHIHINKKMSKLKPLWFGLFTSILIGSSWLLKDKTTSIENIFTLNYKVDFAAIVYIVSIVASSAFLYAFFNKK